MQAIHKSTIALEGFLLGKRRPGPARHADVGAVERQTAEVAVILPRVRNHEISVVRDVGAGVVQVVVPVKERVGETPGILPPPQVPIQFQRPGIPERNPVALLQCAEAAVGEGLVSARHGAIGEDGVDVVHLFVEVAAQLDQSEVGEEIPSGIRLEDHVPVSVDDDRVVAPDRLVKAPDVVVITVVEDVAEAHCRPGVDVVRLPAEKPFGLHVRLSPPPPVAPNSEMTGQPLGKDEVDRPHVRLVVSRESLDVLIGAREDLTRGQMGPARAPIETLGGVPGKQHVIELRSRKDTAG